MMTEPVYVMEFLAGTKTHVVVFAEWPSYDELCVYLLKHFSSKVINVVDYTEGKYIRLLANPIYDNRLNFTCTITMVIPGKCE